MAINAMKYKHLVIKELKETFKISLPLVSSQLINAACVFISTVIIAKLGKDYLAANVIVSTIWAGITVFFLSILNSVSILISHDYGANNGPNINMIIKHAYALGIILTIFILIILAIIPMFLNLSHQPAQIIMLAKAYIYSLMFAAPGLVFLVIMEHILISTGRSNIVMRMNFIVMPVEILLIYAFVLGQFGFPKLGMVGVGLSLSLTYTCTAVVCGILVGVSFPPPIPGTSPKTAEGKLRRKSILYKEIIDFNLLKKLLSIGLPIGFTSAVELGTFMLITLYVSHYGVNMLVAHQIALQYFNFAVTLIIAMSQALTIRVGYLLGKNDISGIKRIIYSSIGLNLFIMFLVAAIFYLYPLKLLQFDIDVYKPENISIVYYASNLLALCGIILVFENLRIIGIGALRGLKDTKATLYISCFGFCVIGISLAYVFGQLFNISIIGVWSGILFGVICSTILIHLR